MTPTLRLGTRGSTLALIQANMVKDALVAHYTDLFVEIVPIKTTGDLITDKALADIGGKGLFIKEIEEQLLLGNIDVAVHSLKDMPAHLDDRLEVTTILEREDARDVLLSFHARTIIDLPNNITLSTSSPRRAAQVQHLRPDIAIHPLRGNVPTRIEKFKEHAGIDTTLLALAGLKRLGMFDPSFMHPLPIHEMIPSIGQGAIGLEILKGNQKIQELIDPLNHLPSAICVHAERIFLAHFETTSCRSPIAAHAYFLDSHTILFLSLIASPDGTKWYSTNRTTSPLSLHEAVLDAALELQSQAGVNFFG
jgi:hydroxymethylbilane synthase